MDSPGLRATARELPIVHWTPELRDQLPRNSTMKLMSLLQRKLHVFNPRFVKWASKVFEPPTGWYTASIEYLAAMTLLHLCKSVTLVGFDVYEGEGGTAAVEKDSIMIARGRAEEIQRAHVMPMQYYHPDQAAKSSQAASVVNATDFTYLQPPASDIRWHKPKPKKRPGKPGPANAREAFLRDALGDGTLSRGRALKGTFAKPWVDIAEEDGSELLKDSASGSGTVARSLRDASNRQAGRLREQACLWELRKMGILQTIGEPPPAANTAQAGDL
mmetsp:Transcript_32865/g.77932  ORF Transcript_32865/g.77932 Transcript_32865/m.77932 type:complete len:274 (-) Transcript_32865:136-957(-)